MSMDADLAAGAQPRCPHCSIVMRDVDAAWTCPSCGHTEPWPAVTMPPHFEGPDIADYPARR
jgi:ribosomal protein S27AE